MSINNRMELNRTARKQFTLEMAATDIAGGALDPAVTYEASFDSGANWVAGLQIESNGWWQWLVAGPDHDVDSDPLPDGYSLAATLTAYDTQPWIRVVDSPELDVLDNGPTIRLTPP